jgi:hypothetical protein
VHLTILYCPDLPSDIETREMSVAESLQQSTDEGEDGNTHQAGFSAPFVGDGECYQSANNGAGLHDADEVGGEV